MSYAMQKLVARVRGSDAPNYAENREEEQVHLSSYGDQIQSQGLPLGAELSRLGETWQVLFAAATGLAVVPTTAGLATIWNMEPGNGKFLAIDSVACFRPIADVTTVDLATIWAQTLRPPMAIPTDAGLIIRSLSGRYSYGGRVRTTATTSVALANRWEPIGQLPNVATAIAGTLGESVEIGLLGRFIVPPGGAFTVTASEVTATASAFRFAIRWHEIQLPLVS